MASSGTAAAASSQQKDSLLRHLLQRSSDEENGKDKRVKLETRVNEAAVESRKDENKPRDPVQW